MKKFLAPLSCLLAASALAAPPPPLVYTGEARDKGQLLYTEKHLVNFGESGRVLRSKTDYLGPDGRLLAVLEADYARSLTTPDYSFRDFRTGNLHGVENKENGILLFNQDPGKTRETKVLGPEESKDRVLFGCQGLNYYVVENIAKLEANSSIPIKFLLPGGLEAYNFQMSLVGKSPDGIADLEIRIENFFLRLFAPKLRVKYDVAKKRLLRYEGLSNLNDEKGKPRLVTIEYRYAEQ